MSTPSPLNSLNPPKPAAGASRMRFAVALIVSAHVIVIGGLLLQGCDRKAARVDETTPVPTNGMETPLFNAATNASVLTNLTGLPTPTNPPIPAPSFGAAGGSNGFANSPAPLPEPAPAPAETAQPREYTVVKGDSPARIAKANGVSLPALLAANPGLVPSKLKIGQKIAIPALAAPAPVKLAPGASTVSAEPVTATAGTHVVKAGDTLVKIARQHGVTVAQIRTANAMKTNRLLVGQKLKIPTRKPATTAATAPAK